MSKERIIFALDVPNRMDAEKLIGELEGEVGAFKIGLQLFTAEGPSFVKDLTDRGLRVFLDVKFHDIPQTVALASIEVARLGVWMFNIHISGGKEMIRKTVEEVRFFCKEQDIERPIMIGVTVLTSIDKSNLRDTGTELEPAELSVKYAQIAKECGLDGVVASPLDAKMIRKAINDDTFIIVTPGIRPTDATNNDQKRVTTPRAAIESGANYLVVGRPVRDADDRREAARNIVKELDLESTVGR